MLKKRLMTVGLMAILLASAGLAADRYEIWARKKGTASTVEWYSVGPQYNVPVLKGTVCGTASVGAPALAVANYFVTDTAMTTDNYTLAHSDSGDGMARNVTVAVTTDNVTDTLGYLMVYGTNWAGDAITDNITLATDNSTVAGTKAFKTITRLQTPAWVTGGGGGAADHIVIGFGNRIGLPQEVITAAVANRYLSSATMKATNYTVLNSGLPGDGCARNVVISHTANDGADNLTGGLWVYGTDWAGTYQAENIALTSGGSAAGSKCFRTVTRLVTAGWDNVSTADAISVGTGTLMVTPDGSPSAGTVDLCTLGTAIIEATVTGGRLETSTIDASGGTYDGSKKLRVWMHH